MTYYTSGKAVYRRIEKMDGETKRHICDAADEEGANILASRLNEYSSSQYMADADKTNSTIFRPEQVSRQGLINLLTEISMQADFANKLKKLLFRGKTCEELDIKRPDIGTGLETAVEFGPHEVNVLHGAIGVITEAGEVADMLVRWLNTGKLDATNVNEESGDMLWYIVRMLRGVDRSLEHCMTTNVDKLHGRHGDKFDPFKDANRDLAAERAALEKADAEDDASTQAKFDLAEREGRVVPGTEKH